MPHWSQHLLVLTLVAACLAYTGYHGVRALWGRKARLGSCCSKGCSSAPKPAATADRMVFFPTEMLRKKK